MGPFTIVRAWWQLGAKKGKSNVETNDPTTSQSDGSLADLQPKSFKLLSSDSSIAGRSALSGSTYLKTRRNTFTVRRRWSNIGDAACCASG